MAISKGKEVGKKISCEVILYRNNSLLITHPFEKKILLTSPSLSKLLSKTDFCSTEYTWPCLVRSRINQR